MPSIYNPSTENTPINSLKELEKFLKDINAYPVFKPSIMYNYDYEYNNYYDINQIDIEQNDEDNHENNDKEQNNLDNQSIDRNENLQCTILEKKNHA